MLFETHVQDTGGPAVLTNPPDAKQKIPLSQSFDCPRQLAFLSDTFHESLKSIPRFIVLISCKFIFENSSDIVIWELST